MIQHLPLAKRSLPIHSRYDSRLRSGATETQRVRHIVCVYGLGSCVTIPVTLDHISAFLGSESFITATMRMMSFSGSLAAGGVLYVHAALSVHASDRSDGSHPSHRSQASDASDSSVGRPIWLQRAKNCSATKCTCKQRESEVKQ